ncbi:hypothetical protein [Acetobacter sp.]|uniref:hypothetical protein n=1 Tax=Acetobacter sp. TaxID=440 RepID=UPI0039E77B6B
MKGRLLNAFRPAWSRQGSGVVMRWLVVLCVLLGLVGQLALQSQARLDEAPRATFERLTGLHIGPDRDRGDAGGLSAPQARSGTMAGMDMSMPDMSERTSPNQASPSQARSNRTRPDRAMPEQAMSRMTGPGMAAPVMAAPGLPAAVVQAATGHGPDSSPPVHPAHGGHHHHDDGECPLCPLLHLPAVVLALACALVLLGFVLRGPGYATVLPRTPLWGRITVLPPATGPPAPV